MDTNDIPNRTPSPWIPTTNLLELGVLGKIAEEAGELASAAARCIVQGINEKGVTSGKINKVWLEEELGDLQALIMQATKYLNLDINHISTRTAKKFSFAEPWYESLKGK